MFSHRLNLASFTHFTMNDDFLIQFCFLKIRRSPPAHGYYSCLSNSPGYCWITEVTYCLTDPVFLQKDYRSVEWSDFHRRQSINLDGLLEWLPDFGTQAWSLQSKLLQYRVRWTAEVRNRLLVHTLLAMTWPN